MIKYLLDTDTISLLQEKHPNVVRRVTETPRDMLAITVITDEEQLSGGTRISDRPEPFAAKPAPMSTWRRWLRSSADTSS